MIEKKKTQTVKKSCQASAIADHTTSTPHWDRFEF